MDIYFLNSNNFCHFLWLSGRLKASSTRLRNKDCEEMSCRCTSGLHFSSCVKTFRVSPQYLPVNPHPPVGASLSYHHNWNTACEKKGKGHILWACDTSVFCLYFLIVPFVKSLFSLVSRFYMHWFSKEVPVVLTLLTCSFPPPSLCMFYLRMFLLLCVHVQTC